MTRPAPVSTRPAMLSVLTQTTLIVIVSPDTASAQRYRYHVASNIRIDKRAFCVFLSKACLFEQHDETFICRL